MKGLKKLALATAVAAAPFAQAEMTAMDDAFLGEMTGQAGVTIELDTAISIDTFTYNDTDGAKGGPAGSLVMSNIQFGGGLVGGSTSGVHDTRLDDFKIDIDVDGTEGLVIHLGGTDSAAGLIGANPVDFGLSIDGVQTSGMTGQIASDIKIAGNLGPIDIKINNVSGGDLIDVQAYFEVTSGSLDVDVAGMGISNLKIGQNSSPIFAGDYQGEINQALFDNNLVGAATGVSSADLKTAMGNTGALVTAGIDLAAGGDGTGTATDAGVIAVAIASIEKNAGVDTATATAMFNGAEVAPGVTMADLPDDTARRNAYLAGAPVNAAAQNATNMAFVHMTIGSGDASYSNLTEGDVTVENALIVDLVDFNIDVSMDISMGETVVYDVDGITELSRTERSLGNIAIDNLQMSGTTLKIYGH